MGVREVLLLALLLLLLETPPRREFPKVGLNLLPALAVAAEEDFTTDLLLFVNRGVVEVGVLAPKLQESDFACSILRFPIATGVGSANDAVLLNPFSDSSELAVISFSFRFGFPSSH